MGLSLETAGLGRNCEFSGPPSWHPSLQHSTPHSAPAHTESKTSLKSRGNPVHGSETTSLALDWIRLLRGQSVDG